MLFVEENQVEEYFSKPHTYKEIHGFWCNAPVECWWIWQQALQWFFLQTLMDQGKRKKCLKTGGKQASLLSSENKCNFYLQKEQYGGPREWQLHLKPWDSDGAVAIMGCTRRIIANRWTELILPLSQHLKTVFSSWTPSTRQP